MTLEEMIKFIEGSDMAWTHAEDVVAALKAGQEMYKDLDENEAGYTAGQAAWDAAIENGAISEL